MLSSQYNVELPFNQKSYAAISVFILNRVEFYILFAQFEDFWDVQFEVLLQKCQLPLIWSENRAESLQLIEQVRVLIQIV